MENNTRKAMTYHQRHRKCRQYYKENKEKLKKTDCKRYKGYLMKKRIKKRKYARDRYGNMSKEDKQKLRERKNNRIQGTRFFYKKLYF